MEDDRIYGLLLLEMGESLEAASEKSGVPVAVLLSLVEQGVRLDPIKLGHQELTRLRRQATIAKLRLTAKGLRVTKDSGPTRGDGTIARVRDAASGMDHLADLLTHHGHQGGYPNFRVPDCQYGPRRYDSPHAMSLSGSPAAMCAQSGSPA
jgi:hypothetical protein